MRVDLETASIPDIFAQFQRLIGARHWLNRVTAIQNEIRGNPFLREYLIEENSIALQLHHCSELAQRFGDISAQETQNRQIYPAMSFAAQTLSIAERSTNDQIKQLVGRIRGAFRNPDEMRAIRLELVAATHFVRRGHAVSWPEMEGSGNFDLLVHNIGTCGLEVECKSISNDKGRKIHRREALDFNTLLSRDLEGVIKGLTRGLVVVMTIPGRLPGSLQTRRQLVKRVIATVLSGKSTDYDDGVHMRLSEFNIHKLISFDSKGKPFISRRTLDTLTQTVNREIMVLGRRSAGAVIFAIQSRDDDKFMESIFSTIAQSAKTQVTGTRPALYLVGFNSVGMDGLMAVAKQDNDSNQAPSALRVGVSKFLRSEDRDHVVGVGFLSNSSLIPKHGGDVESGGSAYVFPRRESALWSDDFSGLFS